MGFENFCLARAGPQGLAAPWSQGCPGAPDEVAGLLPPTPHSISTHLAALPQTQRRDLACPAPPPSHRQLLLPFLHPKAAGQHQHSNSRRLWVTVTPACCPGHPALPRAAPPALAPMTYFSRRWSMAQHGRITVPAAFSVPSPLGLGWGEAQVGPAQQSLRQTSGWSETPPGPRAALAPAH